MATSEPVGEPRMDAGRVRGARHLGRTRRPAFVVFVTLAGVAAATLVYRAVFATPEEWLTGVLWVVWAIAAFCLVARADLYESVPGSVLVAGFVWGLLCLMYSGPLVELLGQLVQVPDEWTAAVYAPLPEEAAKYLGVVLIALTAPSIFTRPLGAVLVGAAGSNLPNSPMPTPSATTIHEPADSCDATSTPSARRPRKPAHLYQHRR